MNTYDVRALIENKKKQISTGFDFYHIYKLYKDVCEKNNIQLTEFDAFYAGYILANPIVRDNLKKTEIKIKDDFTKVN